MAGFKLTGSTPDNNFPKKLTAGPNSIDNPYLAISSLSTILNSAKELSAQIALISFSALAAKIAGTAPNEIPWRPMLLLSKPIFFKKSYAPKTSL